MQRQWEPEELITCWTLIEDDGDLIGNRSGTTRLGFALILKCFELEARFPRHSGDIPKAAVVYVARQVRVDPKAFAAYEFEAPLRPRPAPRPVGGAGGRLGADEGQDEAGGAVDDRAREAGEEDEPDYQQNHEPPLVQEVDDVLLVRGEGRAEDPGTVQRGYRDQVEQRQGDVQAQADFQEPSQEPGEPVARCAASYQGQEGCRTYEGQDYVDQRPGYRHQSCSETLTP